MNLIVTAIILHLTTCLSATNTTDELPTNKTKRTVAGQVHNYAENRPVVLYPESAPVPHALPLYAPATLKPVFEPDLPKQVAAQQVLYEFQQTPTNAVSNVHVNQFYQPLASKDGGPAQFGSETVATPVQHSNLVRHGQNYAQVQYHPLPQHVQTHQYIPGKLLYVNGKITYPGQQGGLQQQHHGMVQQNGFQQQQRPNFLYTHPQAGTQKFVPPPLLVRSAYRRFQPPQPHQIQAITKPSVPEVTEEPKAEEVEEEENVQKEEEEEEEETEDGEKDSYEEDDEDDRYFSKYSFDDDDGNYREDDDEDSERGSSRPVPKKHRKKTTKPNKYNKSDGYKFSESYSSSSKYEKPMKSGKKVVKNAKMPVKAIKGSKSSKPRSEKIEGKQSQNIPVVHKQKIFKEKWYVTKSTDGSML